VVRRLNKVNPQEVANTAWAFATVIPYKQKILQMSRPVSLLQPSIALISAHTLDLLTHGRGRR